MSGSEPLRLDLALVAAGLARSRNAAAQLIASGLVTVNGRVNTKSSFLVKHDDALATTAKDHYVSRAALKLLDALDAFGIEVAGLPVLDTGASTGGFCQVLLERGAKPVVGIDVGHDQLAPELKGAEGLYSLEGVNARELTPELLQELLGFEFRPQLVTVDVSFISVTQILPALRATAAANAEYVILVKPQFEVGKQRVRGGLVTNPLNRAEAIDSVVRAAAREGLFPGGLRLSPITGTHGNSEYLLWLRNTKTENTAEWRQQAKIVAGV